MNAPARDRSIPPILPIIGVAGLVRLLDLGGRPMWYDEALTAMQSEGGLASMLYGTSTAGEGVAGTVHPILYHTLLWMWEQVVGSGPAPVRLLSVLMGLGVVVAGYFLARLLFADRVATLTGWALTFSPFQVHYSQEVSMYALLALLLVSATLVYWRAVHRGRWIHWLIFAALAAAAEYTHSLAAVYLIPLGATAVILRRWKQVLYTLEAGLLAFLLYVPWLLHTATREVLRQQSTIMTQPNPVDLVRTLLIFLVGFPVPSWALSVAVFCSVFLIVVAIVTTVRERAANPALTRRAIWLIYLSAAPVGLMYLTSIARPAYLDPAMLAAAVAFLIWIVWALERKALASGLIYLGYAALSLSFLVGLYGFFTYRGFPYAPYPELDGYLAAHIRPGEVVLHESALSAVPATYYANVPSQYFLADPAQPTATHGLPGIEPFGDVQSAVGDADGVWFIIFSGEIHDSNPSGETQPPSFAWLGARYSVERIESFGELRVYHFVRPGEDLSGAPPSPG
jgi:mannosyltransferase